MGLHYTHQNWLLHNVRNKTLVDHAGTPWPSHPSLKRKRSDADVQVSTRCPMHSPLLAAHLTGPNQGSNSQRTQIGDPNALTAILAILKKRKTQLGMANGMAGIDS